MRTYDMLKQRREEIIALAGKRGASNIRGFGSVIRGDNTGDSDIDFLVDMETGRSLLDHSGLVLDLQEMLGQRVDVVTERSLYWLLKRKILKEARAL